MKNNYFRYYKPGAIITFILLAGSIIGLIATLIIKIISDNFDFSYYQYPTTTVIIGLLIYGIDKAGFNRWPFRLLFDIPFIHGRYEGEIAYTNPINNMEESKQCAIEVFQTGSKIKVNSYFQKTNGEEKTPSKSLIESIILNDDDTYSLIFTYQNEGLNGKFPPHTGTNVLKVIINDHVKSLKGNYYTNREPQTKGYVDVKFITKKLKNDF